MDLSLENLDDIYHSLIVFEKNGENFFKDFEYVKGIGISSNQRKLLDTLVNGISAYILEVSYIKSFLQSCDYLPKEVIITAPQKETLKICYQLCEKLEPIVADKPSFQVLQVKEKLGGLRFYTNYSDDAISALVASAEIESIHTCEVCGRPGRRGGTSWIETRCDEHANAS